MSINEIDRRAGRMTRSTPPFLGIFVALVLVIGAVAWAMDGFTPVPNSGTNIGPSTPVTTQNGPTGEKPAPNPMSPAPQAP